VQACARSAEVLRQLARRFPPPHGFQVVDVSREEEVAAWARSVLAGGEIDLVINNAGLVNRSAPLWQVPAEEFSRLMAVNVGGTANVIRHFLPAMIARGQGVVVNFSSGWGRSASAHVAPYCATKWAIEGLTLALARELPAGMAAVALNPGIIDTQMLRICFGEAAASYPDPVCWARRAVPYLLGLGPDDNGRSLSVPS
jgi:NAD(P)-dependent dehydrogenase (short-subunit alcohol dehydrogenase family)